jgi:hypothetical protein
LGGEQPDGGQVWKKSPGLHGIACLRSDEKLSPRGVHSFRILRSSD